MKIKIERSIFECNYHNYLKHFYFSVSSLTFVHTTKGCLRNFINFGNHPIWEKIQSQILYPKKTSSQKSCFFSQINWYHGTQGDYTQNDTTKKTNLNRCTRWKSCFSENEWQHFKARSKYLHEKFPTNEFLKIDEKGKHIPLANKRNYSIKLDNYF